MPDHEAPTFVPENGSATLGTLSSAAGDGQPLPPTIRLYRILRLLGRGRDGSDLRGGAGISPSHCCAEGDSRRVRDRGNTVPRAELAAVSKTPRAKVNFATNRGNSQCSRADAESD